MRKIVLMFLLAAYVESIACWWIAKKHFKHMTWWYGPYIVVLLILGTLYFGPKIVGFSQFFT